jgi:hypothetical protein
MEDGDGRWKMEDGRWKMEEVGRGPSVARHELLVERGTDFSEVLATCGKNGTWKKME